MSKESYVRGFCKAAESAGVDPVALAKYAQWWYNPLSWFSNSGDDNNRGRGRDSGSGIGIPAENAIGTMGPSLPSKDGVVRAIPVHHIKRKETRNNRLHPGSYFAKLLRNSEENADAIDALNRSTPKVDRGSFDYNFYNYDMPQRQLDSRRKSQAFEAAEKFFPRNSAPYEKLVQNLIRSGKMNQDSFISTGDVKPRAGVDRTGIKELKLTPEKEKTLKLIQDSMASKGRSRANGNIA